MAVRDQFTGLDALLSLFDTLPGATEDELRDDLPKLGAIVLNAQRQDVAVRTGDLYRALSVQVRNRGLTVQIGLNDISRTVGKSRYHLFYGRFVEFGRRAQPVLVERRRRVGGRLRTLGRRKHPADIVTRYVLNVRAAAPRPFVRGPAAQVAALDAVENLADFWGRVLDRTGSA